MDKPKQAHDRLHEVWGKQVRKHRERKGLTQVALAELVGVEQNTISRIETGARPPSDAMKIELCLALDCDLDDLFGWPLGLLDIAAHGRDAA